MSIGVVQGGGSFSTLRSVVSFANTLRWLFGLNLFEIEANKKTNLDLIKLKTVSDFMIPKYSGVPNISKPKK